MRASGNPGIHEGSLIERGRDLWARLEEKPVSFRAFLVLFFSIITFRNLLESFSSTGYIELLGTYTLHYPLAFVISFLMLSLLLSALSTERIEKVSRLMFYLWLLILLPPVVDLILAAAGRGEKRAIGWLKYAPGSFWWTFLNLYNPFVKLEGITLGIRLQSLLSCILAAIYVYVKSKRIWRTLLAPCVISFFSFCFFALPSLFVSLSSLLSPGVVDTRTMIFADANLFRNVTERAATGMAIYQLFLASFLFLLWLVFHDRKKLGHTLLLLDWRAYCISVLCAAFGFVLGWRMFLPSLGVWQLLGNHRDLSAVKAVVLSLWGVALFASSLARGAGRTRGAGPAAAPAYDTWDALLVSLLVAVSFSSVTSYPVLVWILALLLLETVSALEPFSAGSRPGVSAVIGACRAFVSCLLGYSLFAGNLAPILFPGYLALLLLFLFFLVHRFSPLAKRRSFAPVSAYAVSLALLTGILWPRLPGQGERTRHSPQELRHSIFATFLEHDGLDDHALLELEKAYGLGSEDPWVALKLGLAASRSSDKEKALSYYRRALEIEPAHAEALNNILILLTEMGRGEEARGCALRLLETEDESGLFLANAATYFITHREAGLGLGRFLALGRPPESAPGRDAVLRLLLALIGETSPDDLARHLENARADPGDPVKHVSAGASLQKAGRLAEALSFYERGLEAAPSLAALHFVMGSVYQAMGKHEIAVSEYRRFLAEYPGNLEGGINLSVSLLELGKAREALSLLEDLAERHPDHPMLVVNIANAYMKLQDFGKAEKLLADLVARGTVEPLVHYNLAVLLEKQGRHAEALPNFEEAARRGLRSPVLFTKLGQFYESFGDKGKAREMFTEAVKLDPAFLPARKGLAKLDGEGSPEGGRETGE